MVKRKQIDVVTTNVEDKLDANGALRNVAVKDAWQRMRQNIDVKEWKKAETVLKELSDNLQKINMLKSMTGAFSKLKLAFQNPDQLIEENDIVTPREPRGNQGLSSESADINVQKTKYSMDQLCKCMATIKETLDKNNDVPDNIDVPSDVSEDVKSCFKTLTTMCEKYKKDTKERDHLSKRIDTTETKLKDMEVQIKDKDTEINKLSQTVNMLEKKHSEAKEAKMDTMKEQMKMKSLERQVEMKESEMMKLKQDNENLNKRLNEIMDENSTEIADLFNPFPPDKLAEQFKDLFNTSWKESLEFYKTSLKKTEKEATERLMNILSDSSVYCSEASVSQLQRVTSELTYPGAGGAGGGGGGGDTTSQDLSRVEQADIKQIENLRKQTCRFSCDYVKNLFITQLESGSDSSYTLDELTACMSYIERCVEISWYMAVQVPPMYIGFSDNTKQDIAVDKTKYEITRGKGTKVDFVMWPPLYRSKDGQLMTKGCIKTK